jgi:hypothetical protein
MRLKNRMRLNTGRGDFMRGLRMFMVVCALATLMSPSLANAGWSESPGVPPQPSHARYARQRDICRKWRRIHFAKHDLRNDLVDVRQDRIEGNIRDARADLRDIRNDRHQLRALRIYCGGGVHPAGLGGANMLPPGLAGGAPVGRSEGD